MFIYLKIFLQVGLIRHRKERVQQILECMKLIMNLKMNLYILNKLLIKQILLISGKIKLKEYELHICNNVDILYFHYN